MDKQQVFLSAMIKELDDVIDAHVAKVGGPSLAALNSDVSIPLRTLAEWSNVLKQAQEQP